MELNPSIIGNVGCFEKEFYLWGEFGDFTASVIALPKVASDIIDTRRHIGLVRIGVCSVISLKN